MAVIDVMNMRVAADPAVFFNEHYEQVRRFLGAATGAPSADVEDLVQETLLHAWRGRARFRGEASPLTWILSIARNRARLRLRARRREGSAEKALRALAAVETELIPDELLETSELIGRVRGALVDLEGSHARVLIQRYYEGLSVREIAVATGESEKAVESRLHRAREAMRERFRKGAGRGLG